jgi:lambda family phage portal protein
VSRHAREAAARATWLDRVIGWLSPEAGVRRQRARAVGAYAGAYAGGMSGRRTMQAWQPLTGDANADTVHDLPDLRARSRDAIRNLPIATGAIGTMVTHVVGTGLAVRPQVNARVLGLDETEAREWQAATLALFEAWAGSPDCDAARRLDFYGLQALAFRSALESGDCFGLLPFAQRPGAVSPLVVQLIEADRISNPDNRANTETLIVGVELDAMGAPLAYHVASTHPGTNIARARRITWQRVEAYGGRTGRRNVLHLVEILRPGQVRGVPYLAPVIEPLKQISRYSESEVMAAVISAAFTVFVKTESGSSLAEGQLPSAGPANQSPDRSSPNPLIANGLVVDLAEGEEIQTADPKRPNANFDPFVQAVLRQVGVALGLPFEVLIKHYTASYSAARAALLEAWRFFRCRRAWLAAGFCQPVYEAFLDEAVSAGRISAPGYLADPLVRAAWRRALWHGDGMGAIDPLKEIEAAAKRIETGLTTLDQEIAEYDGGDFAAKHEQRVRESRARREGGLEPDAAAPAPAPAAAPEPNPDLPELA